MTDIQIFQGNQIGGCITMISTKTTKIIIDFGESLPGSKAIDNIEFDWKKEKVDAVFFTHYHGDHIGRFMEIPEDIPLYMGKVTFEILCNINQAVKNEAVLHSLKNRSSIIFIRPKQRIEVGDIVVTPYTVDHSAFDAYMFLVETPDQNILHTGDYRDHGHRGHVKKNGKEINVMLEVIKRYVKDYGRRKIDVLITEGTMLGGRKNEKRYSEKQLLQDATAFFKEHKYIFLKISSTNADSIASFYHAAGRNGMGFYANRYVLSQLDSFARAGSEYTDFYSFDRKWPILFGSGEKQTAQRKHMREDGFVILVSEYENYENLIQEFADLDTVMIYSLWNGYIDEQIGKKAFQPELADFCKRHNAVSMHTGGHAYPEFVEEVIKTVAAEKVMIIHTEGEKMETLFKDSDLVKHKRRLKDALEEIATILREAHESADGDTYLRNKLLNGWMGNKEHKPNHEACNGFDDPAKGNLKEKRICHCMYYYMKKPEVCEKCSLKNKWKNVGDIEITDFEVPTKYVYDKVGGMDLILGGEYAVEIKPPHSPETLSRMFAEILTYTIETDPAGNKYKPAICLFHTEGNEQMKQFMQLRKDENPDLKYIMEKVKVFYFEVSSLEDEIIEYSIHPIEELIE